MENEHNDRKPYRRPNWAAMPYTADEIKALKEKRFVEKFELQRLFGEQDNAFYSGVDCGLYVPSEVNGKKRYDLDDIYRKLEEGKGKGRNGWKK